MVAILRWLLCLYLLTWEPLNLASEALGAWSTLGARGTWAVVELAAHVVFTIMAVAGGMALWNRAPHGVVLAQLGVGASTARTIQVGRFSTLPHDTSPDLLPLLTIAALVNCFFWSGFLNRYEDQLTDHRT